MDKVLPWLISQRDIRNEEIAMIPLQRSIYDDVRLKTLVKESVVLDQLIKIAHLELLAEVKEHGDS